MSFLEALQAAIDGKRGLRRKGWTLGIRVRWADRLGWQWETERMKPWTDLPLTAFYSEGIMGAPNLLRDDWELA